MSGTDGRTLGGGGGGVDRVGSGLDELGAWWRQVEAVALVGTARRPVPAMPALGVVARPGARPETELLDAVAVGGAVLRAGRPPSASDVPPPAPPDRRPSAPDQAVRMLDLLLTQPPTGARLRDDLVLAWCRAAHRYDVRLPHRFLPVLLDLGSARPGLREAITSIEDERGAWLAARRDDWAWAATVASGGPTSVDALAWARLPSTERVELLRRLRRSDPASARALMATTWDTDPANARRAHLEVLGDQLGPGDEDVLEGALDDRAATVRAAAVRMLDGLPGSARGRRMRDRLAPLIQPPGEPDPPNRPARTITVSLPDAPDPSGLRDGLDVAPRGRSQRGWWLQRMVAGAPLEIWTELTRADPGSTVGLLDSDDVLRGLEEAALARSDAEWVAALLAHRWDDRLLAVLTPEVREQVVVDRLRDPLTTSALTSLLAATPGPWSASFGNTVIARLAAEPSPGPILDRLGSRLAVDLHPDTLFLLRRWLARPGHSPRVASTLRDLVQFLSLHRSIDEAF